MADYEIIAEGTLTSTATSINITSIPATYTHLELFLNSRSTKAAASTSGGETRVNGIAGGASYGQVGVYILNSASTTIVNQTGSNGNYSRSQIDNSHRIINDNMPANTYGTSRMVIPNYANTTITSKGFLIYNSAATSNTSAYWQMVSYGFVVSSAAVNRIELFAEVGGSPYKAGTSYYLAGYK